MTTEPSGAGGLRLSLKLLWEAPQRPSRGPKPGLTLAQIVDVAIAIADAEGLDALSMRRVARELGVGTMSLYRYVPGKTQLLDLMLDRVSAPGPSAACADWRTLVAAVARHSRQLYLAHPWLLQANWTRPALGPNTLAGLEIFVAGLDGLGLTNQERISLLVMVHGYVIGVTRNQVLRPAAVAESGLSDEEFWTLHSPFLERAMATGNYPAMAALDADAFGLGWDETFEWGLQRLLDGLQTLIDSRSVH